MNVKETVFISMSIEDLQTLIVDCVNSCLKHYKPDQKEPDGWLSLSELCNYIPDKPTKPTVYGWVHAGKIPVYKGGKSLRFLKSEIDNWLKDQKKVYAPS